MTALLVVSLLFAIGILLRAGFVEAKEETLVRSAERRPAFGLPEPSMDGWQRDIFGGWVAHVEQGRYGHPAKKATWLYAFGVDAPPSLRWGRIPDSESRALVSWCGNHVKSSETRPRVGKAVASRTPLPFRDVLIGIARSVKARAA